VVIGATQCVSSGGGNGRGLFCCVGDAAVLSLSCIGHVEVPSLFVGG
jgi:hypothetical protein